MARTKSTNLSQDGGGVNPNAIYAITVDAPFMHNGIQFVPSKDRAYQVSGKVLVDIMDKVKEFYPLT